MTSPLPTNAKRRDQDGNGYDDLQEAPLSSSLDRMSSMARLQASGADVYGSSPHSYIGHDLTQVSSHQSLASQYSSNDNKLARAVKRHLADPNAIHRSSTPVSSASSVVDLPSSYANSGDEEVSVQSGSSNGNHFTGSIHQLPGASITHDIYKWTDNIDEQLARKKRSQSFIHPRNEPIDPALARLKDPGGFRRHFVVDKAARQGKAPPHWMTNTFVEFLALYGHFGGEDLSEEEEEEEEEEGFVRHDLGERTPLIRRPTEDQPHGNVTASKAVFLLIKAFFGTGPMFLPKAFSNGGLFFSCALLTFIAIISLYSFLLLVETRNKVPLSFGDIGGHLFGPSMRYFVLVSIAVSQIGFVCAYMVFVGQNVQALVEALTDCEMIVPLSYLIWGQIAIFVPLAMIRKIQKLSIFALLADLFILLGVLYLFYYDFWSLTLRGIGQVDWIINPASFPMFVGTAVFTFEGVGLIIPITESMKDPKQFPKVLSGTMIGLAAVFLAVGSISYLTFGKNVQTVILLNLPPNPIVNTLQGLYALAICLSIPLQLFPAIRIVENALFTRSGKHNPIVKWQKNMLRLMTVILSAGIATAGSQDLDKFVSVIGSVCCVPLCFLFPPLFHYKAIARSVKEKVIDMLIIVFAVICMTYTTWITISLWFSDNQPDSPPPTRCIPH
ncbi:transmembrane amino acid transporter protein-domain-containing protein [Halteromyces radiatus]|uniref:transmembrane amino acid transporter protein-domain-containing protein n=1 Tax=Halteromyces radiatus TaxID=101107 RepID=UPI00221E6679|nr:transmembrane amino acid transporter protein-domain-containing protein [Halteromyces radiatus]KAI8076783.1 transmembrane amino acid transporter protein-domain-containing protein [Halteromyces radiatus]